MGETRNYKLRDPKHSIRMQSGSRQQFRSTIPRLKSFSFFPSRLALDRKLMLTKGKRRMNWETYKKKRSIQYRQAKYASHENEFNSGASRIEAEST